MPAIKTERKDIENNIINVISEALEPHNGVVRPGRHRLREPEEIKDVFTIRSPRATGSGRRKRVTDAGKLHGWEFFRTDQEALRAGEEDVPTNHVWLVHTYELNGFYTYDMATNSEDKFNDAVDAVSNTLNGTFRIRGGPILIRATSPIVFDLEEIAGVMCHTASATVEFIEDLKLT